MNTIKKEVIDFKTYINYFLGNLWHDASEVPQKDKNILLEFSDNSYVVINLRSKYDIPKYPYKSVTRWLYFDDLMKVGM